MSVQRETLDKLLDCVVQVVLEDGGDAGAARVAAMFCTMSDDGQAKFFDHVARLMEHWGPGKREMQAAYIANHLQKCSCIGPAAREFVRAIGDGVRP